jgi:hypothetical protein
MLCTFMIYPFWSNINKQYLQNEQLLCSSNHRTQKKAMTCANGNPGPSLEQIQICARVKMVKRIDRSVIGFFGHSL